MDKRERERERQWNTNERRIKLSWRFYRGNFKSFQGCNSIWKNFNWRHWLRLVWPTLNKNAVALVFLFQTLSVLNPLRSTDQSILQDTDLAGPLVFILTFGALLLLVRQLIFNRALFASRGGYLPVSPLVFKSLVSSHHCCCCCRTNHLEFFDLLLF